MSQRFFYLDMIDRLPRPPRGYRRMHGDTVATVGGWAMEIGLITRGELSLPMRLDIENMKRDQGVDAGNR